FQLRRGVRGEQVVMGEPDEPVRMAGDDAGQGLVAAAGREPDPADAVRVELRQPAIGLHLGRWWIGLGLWEVPGRAPGRAVLLGLLLQVPGLLVGRAARGVGPGPAAGHRNVAGHGEMTVKVDDFEILEHLRAPRLGDGTPLSSLPWTFRAGRA